MALIRRDLPAEVDSEIVNEATQPFYIVKIEFTSGTSYYSESWEVTFESNVYSEHTIKVNTFRWNAEGGQQGSVSILNENNVASSLVLNNAIEETPITIYKVYRKSDTTFTAPVIYAKGVLSGSQLNPTEARLEVLTSGAMTEFVPNEFFTQAEGYTALPGVGTVVTWNGEKYVLEGKDDL